jgi:hypothetical protein
MAMLKPAGHCLYLPFQKRLHSALNPKATMHCSDYGRERVLQKWTPAADDSTLESIEDSTISGGGGGGRWDQFAAAANQISQATAKVQHSVI